MSAHTAHIELDVRVDGDGIRGEAWGAGGPPRPFSGWLGLIGALDRLLSDSVGQRPDAAGRRPEQNGDRT